jgi:hypothetical protein
MQNLIQNIVIFKKYCTKLAIIFLNTKKYNCLVGVFREL